MSWYYNTESGALTSAGAIQSFMQDLQSGVGLGVGWHKLNISDTATGVQAAAEAVKEFPSGKAPTTSVEKQVVNSTPVVGNAVNTYEDTAHALSAIWDTVSDGRRWRSLGWIFLGILLIFIGLALLIGEKVAKVAGKLPIPLPI